MSITDLKIFKNCLCEAMSVLKGFTVKYSSVCDDKILIFHDKRVFLLTITDVTGTKTEYRDYFKE